MCSVLKINFVVFIFIILIILEMPSIIVVLCSMFIKDVPIGI